MLKSKIKNPNQAGFTLIEIMVVVIILAILAAIIVPKIMDRPEQARIVKAKEDITSLENALGLYKLDNGVYPTTAQGLKALVTIPTTAPIPQQYANGGYIKEAPMDPWGHFYQYLQPGKHGDIDIFTYDPNRLDPLTKQPILIGNWNIDKIK